MSISKKRLAEIDAIGDEAIDTSDNLELGESFFQNARLSCRAVCRRKTVTMRLDQDVFDWFKGQGKGHLTRMNAVLRAYMLSRQPD